MRVSTLRLVVALLCLLALQEPGYAATAGNTDASTAPSTFVAQGSYEHLAGDTIADQAGTPVVDSTGTTVIDLAGTSAVDTAGNADSTAAKQPASAVPAASQVTDSAVVAPAPSPSSAAETAATGTDSDRRLQARDAVIIEYQASESEDEHTAEAVAQIFDQRLFYLDANGILNLPIIGAVPLAGLNQEEAVSRLHAEQLLRDVTLTVQILPLDPQGTASLKPFGYDLFSSAKNNFEPGSGLPIPADYVVAPGDTVQVQLFGKKTDNYQLVVTPEGVLNFLELGPINVGGLSFSQVEQELKQRISTQMIGVTANITMGPLSSITVFVVGEVNAPGSYTVSALSTVTNALAGSGGIKPTGSLRNIQLKRDGKVIGQLDLYDLLLHGEKRSDQRLRPNDVIFVAPLGPVATVSGEVLRPAVYELRGERNVKQLLALAGGLTPNARPGWARIARIEPERGRVTVDIDLSTGAGLSAPIHTGDSLSIPAATERVEGEVTMQGRLRNPGSYPWRTGLTVSDLIRSSWDLLPDADLDYAVLVHHRAHSEALSVESVRLRDVLDGGRSVALEPLDTLMVFSADQNADRQALLKPVLDQLRLQARAGEPSPVVSIGGMAGAPGDYPLEAGMKVSGLLRASGKLGESAYTLDAELTRYHSGPDGTRAVDHLPVDLAGVIAGKPGADLVLMPFDYLLIRPAPAWQSQSTVQIVGEVRFPGTYPIARGEQLSSVIKRAGGVTNLAFPRGAVFLREDLKAREADQLARLANRLEASLAAASQNKLATPDQEEAITVGNQVLAEVRATAPMGRLVIDLPSILKADGKDREGRDVTLKAGDVLYIPEASQDVMVMGEVYYPTTHLWEGGQNWVDYINLSGGYTEKSDKKRVYVIRANGSVVPGDKLSSSRSGNSSGMETRGMLAWNTDAGVEPGDTIIVPLDVDRYKTLDVYSKLSTIFFQVGTTAAQLERAFKGTN